VKTETHDRILTAVDNLKGAGTWRPKDYLNFVNMLLNMPKPKAVPDELPHPARMALTVFTRMKISYLPGDRNSTFRTPSNSASSDPAEEAHLHIMEPTVALFVDAPEHLSGVSLTLKSWADCALRQGRPLFMHMAGSDTGTPGCKSFPAVGTLHFKSYEGLDIPVPDVKAVSGFMSKRPFDVAHLSTPGPMGLLGMRLARDAGVPVCGTYHTDFPRYVRELTGSELLEERTWAYMRWFYGQMDQVAAPSQATRMDLIDHGLDPERVHVVGRGVCPEKFSPEHRSLELRQRWGAGDSTPVLTYVGRISKEKNLPLLVKAYKQLLATGRHAVLTLIGDGPYRAEMEAELADTPAVFTGMLGGQELSAAFASGDLFVFPSETDTFGRVVIEAQASGLPVLISDQGGPRDAMSAERTGRIVPNLTPDRYAEELEEVLADPVRITRWKIQAREHALLFTPDASFEAFWNLHRLALEKGD